MRLLSNPQRRGCTDLVLDLYLGLCLLAALSKGQISIFSPAVTEDPVWKRRPTVCEWYAISAVPGTFVYAAIDLQLWSRGEWDGALFGAPTAFISIVTVVSTGVYWTRTWALRAFEREPPPGYPWQRRQLLGNMWMHFNMCLGINCVVKALIAPEVQELAGNNVDLCKPQRYRAHLVCSLRNVVSLLRAGGNLGIGSMADEGKRYLNRQVLLELGCLFFFIPAVAFKCRAQIYSFLSRPFTAKQRLQDGVFIAALLDASNAEKHDTDLVADAAVLMRRVPMSRVTLQMLGASPRDESYDASASFALGEGCGLGGCDFFVSHSWSVSSRTIARVNAASFLRSC